MNVSVTKVDSSTNVSLTKGATQQSINDALALSLQYKNSASASADSALNSANSASSSASNASLDRASASASATSANTSALNASSSASTASTKASEASTSATNASNSASDASDSADSASSSASSASSSASSALGYKNTTEEYMTTTEGYKNSASSSASSASSSASNASGYATSASDSATTATTQAGIATTKAGEASTSASNAATSESNALSYKNSASSSATSALNSASSASSSASSALGYKNTTEEYMTTTEGYKDTTNGYMTTTEGYKNTTSGYMTTTEGYKNNASASATTATTQAEIATTKAGEASTSASNAMTYRDTAETYATTATTQASNALTSANNADTSEANALTYSNNALASANAADISEANALTYAGNALTSANNAASSLSTFNGKYVSSDTAPSSPTEGMLWYDSISNIMKVYNGSVFVNAGSSVNGTSSRNTYTATAGQTTFSSTYDAGYVDVYRNGLKLAPSDFTATNGTTVVLNNACSLNDVVDIVAYGTFELADAYTKNDTDTLLAAKANQSTTYTKTEVDNKPTGFKNRIINGDMMIDQRGTATTPVAISYSVDRWQAYFSAGTKTLQQVTDAPTGFKKSLKVTTTSASAGSIGLVQQWFEGNNVADFNLGTANAVTFTLSFWVKSSVTGVFSGDFANAVAGAPNRSYPFTYTINSANTWEYKTITAVGDTTGTWATDNSAGLRVLFNLGTGGSSGTAGSWQAGDLIRTSSSVGIEGTLNATWQITGVQLEKGSTATSFDYRPYGTELSLCQRYYEVIPAGTVTIHVDTSNSIVHISSYQFKITKRVSPSFNTITVSHINGGAVYYSQAVEGNTSGITRIGNGTSYSSAGSWLYHNSDSIMVYAEL